MRRFSPQRSLEQWRKVFWISAIVAAGTYVMFQIFGTADVQKWNYPEGRPQLEEDPSTEPLNGSLHPENKKKKNESKDTELAWRHRYYVLHFVLQWYRTTEDNPSANRRSTRFGKMRSMRNLPTVDASVFVSAELVIHSADEQMGCLSLPTNEQDAKSKWLLAVRNGSHIFLNLCVWIGTLGKVWINEHSG